jgi:hypothetical protein
MIESVKQIKTMKASDLPPTFDVLVGDSTTYAMERNPDKYGKVWMHCTDTSENIHIDPDEIITVLVPDTWENAAVDIEFDLMQKGLV